VYKNLTETMIKYHETMENWKLTITRRLTGSQAIPESSPSRPRQEILLYSEEEKGGSGIEEQEREDA
jgi:hypothetical protein